MDTSIPSLEASRDTVKVFGSSNGAEGSVDIAIRDLAINFQAEMSQQVKKFAGEVEAAALQENGSHLHSVGHRDMQLQKTELIIQIQSMAAFITNKLHEHQLMEKLDPVPSASHCQ
ncbi:uncharacterized protein LOC110838935 [Zootermopsis nevadensis]|uniref:Uncharacterized protein n=1 Tax=Zootermopsis nevadensis TaxID=136037 RepID=A0A067QJX2_ZOONE|nr:uncharacterized protein LOC110838935 [Zootermopsis nevadensis]KDR09159.1 hypothetical protein L798_01275 [Zootermopsis nevadensis]